VVGKVQPCGQVLAYFEGNIYGAPDLNEWSERVKLAASRMHERYFTIAKGLYNQDNFDVIGTIDRDMDRWLIRKEANEVR
jgi:hypothetical protein